MSDTPQPEPQTERPQSRLGATLRRLIRTRIMAGLVTTLPILVTIWVVWLVFTWLRKSSQWVVEAVLEGRWVQWLPDSLGITWTGFTHDELVQPSFQWPIAIFSVLLTFLLLYIVGLLTANILGRRLIGLVDRVVERVPLVKTVYRSTKQILSTFSGSRSHKFQRVALVPFPQDRMRCVGFITNVFTDSITGDELCSVFIPTTPNPTTGYLQILKRENITEVNWSVEEAIRTIMSGGILKPDFVTIVPNKELPAGTPKGVGPTPLPPPTQPAKEDPPELNA